MKETQPSGNKPNKQPRKIPPDSLSDRLGSAAVWLTVGSVMAVVGGAVTLGLSIRNGLHTLQNKRSTDPDTQKK